MRVLRFGTSEDREGEFADDRRGYKIAERLLSEAICEPVETILRGAWPSPDFPERFEKAIVEHEPDLVFFKINWFWAGYESVPLRLERKLGRPGKALGKAGVKVGNTPMFAGSRTFQTGRRILTRAIGGGATHFTPQQVVAVVDDCIRRAVTREELVLVVRGLGGWGYAPHYGKAQWRREEARREYITGHIRATCERHHVCYIESARLSKEDLQQRLTPAWFRSGAEGQRLMGEEEGAAMAEAWKQAHRSC